MAFKLRMTDRFPQKRRKTKQELPAPIKEKMKKALNDVHKAVQNLEDETGRRRSDLFREPPDRRVSVSFNPSCLKLLTSDIGVP